MDLMASFPADDIETNELLRKWKSMGASIDAVPEKRFTGGPEILSAVVTLTPLITFLIGRYFDQLKNREFTLTYQGRKIVAKGYSEEKILELLREVSKKAE